MPRFTPFAILFCVSTAAAGEPAHYFGLAPPDVPQIFAPAMLPSGVTLTNVAFSPDFRRAAFSVTDTDARGKVASAIYETSRPGGEWSAPVRTALGAGFAAGEAWFSRDGAWLYYSSDRPPGGSWRPRAFRAAVRAAGLGPPELVAVDVPDKAGVYYPRILANGDLAFTSRGDASTGGGDDLFVARAGPGGYATPEPLAEHNSPQDDWDLVETRDGALRLWISARDVHYARRNASGSWTAARPLAAVNSPALETAPALSPDDAVLFFLRRESGSDRLYWVRLASVLPGNSGE